MQYADRGTVLFDVVYTSYNLKWTAPKEISVSRNPLSVPAGINTYTTKSNIAVQSSCYTAPPNEWSLLTVFRTPLTIRSTP